MIRQLSDDEVKALHYELLLKDIVAAAEKLPPFPDVVWKVMDLIRRTAPVSEIEAVIKYDQVIASRILALSQAVYYGRRFEVRSLQDAILVLGDQKLIQVLMTVCTMRYFQVKDRSRDQFERQLWEHSVSTAMMCEMVARQIKHNKVLSAYTVGLLHDIGKIVLDLYARIYLQTSLEQIRQKGSEAISAERRALGIDHQELGEMIARRWRFPDEVVMAIGHHHSMQHAVHTLDVTTITYMANRIVVAAEGDENAPALDPEKDPVFRKYNITHQVIETLQGKLVDGLSGVRVLLAAP